MGGSRTRPSFTRNSGSVHVSAVSNAAHAGADDALDEGPIIAQDSGAVGHRETIADLERIGSDLERVVLASAVRLHLERRVLLDDGGTVVFQ
jgi:formyltetrahydrofolate deformylase